MRLTLDTNVLRDCIQPDRSGHKSALELLDLNDGGVCDIAITTRLDIDVPDEPLRSQLNQLAVLKKTQRVGPAFRVGYLPQAMLDHRNGRKLTFRKAEDFASGLQVADCRGRLVRLKGEPQDAVATLRGAPVRCWFRRRHHSGAL